MAGQLPIVVMIFLSRMNFDIFVISLKMSLQTGTAKVPFLNHPEHDRDLLLAMME
jgi:hypothetical protein